MTPDHATVLSAQLAALSRQLDDDRRHQEEHRAEVREQLDRIEQHARETNGRVRKLELWQARLQGAGQALTPFRSAALSAITAVVSGAAVYLLTT